MWVPRATWGDTMESTNRKKKGEVLFGASRAYLKAPDYACGDPLHAHTVPAGRGGIGVICTSLQSKPCAEVVPAFPDLQCHFLTAY
jgi:hypothetical protein